MDDREIHDRFLLDFSPCAVFTSLTMNPLSSRRHFLKNSVASGLALAGLGLAGPVAQAIEPIKRSGTSRFKVSVVAYSFRNYFNAKDAAQKIDLFQFMDFVADQGGDGVEVTQYYFPKEVTTEYLVQLRRHAYLRGLAISGTGTGNNFALPKGEKLNEQIARVKERVDYAAILGAPFLRVFSGPAKELSEAEAVKSCISALEECADYAGKKGVFIGLENDQGLTTTVETTLEILKGVKSKWLCSNLDTGNFHATDDVYADLVKLAPYAINVHFKSEVHPRNKEAQPMDVRRILQILRDVNYQGFLAVEYEAKDDPRKGVPELMKRIKDALV